MTRTTSFSMVFATITCLMMLVTANASVQVPCEYEVTVIQAPLCPDFGWPPTFATGLNEHGDVCGYYNACVIGPATPFLWTSNAGFVTLDMPPNVSRAWAWDISDDGVIVGTMDVNGVGFRGFVYDEGRVTELPTVTGVGWSQALAITNGRVVGYRSIEDDVIPHNAFIWSKSEGFLDLGVMGGPNSSATDINKQGFVVGWTGTGTTTSEAFLYKNGVNSLLGFVPDGLTSTPSSIGDNSEVVGWGRILMDGFPFGVTRALLWHDENFVMLGTLPNHLISAAYDLRTNPLQIIGSSWHVDGNANMAHGFIWQDSVLYNLNDLLVPKSNTVVDSAEAINQNGLIAASGFTMPPDAALVALLLSPLEPPTGDLNKDCRVSTYDLLMLFASWGQDNSPADFNNDGTVDELDLIILFDNWG